MAYAVMIGSDLFIGTTGVLTVEIEGKMVEFFRIREIFRVRSEGSYLAVDVDIKDLDGVREIKLAKNNPVAGDGFLITHNKTETRIQRANGSTVICIEQFAPDKKLIPNLERIEELIQQGKIPSIDAVIRITGDFYAGKHHLKINDKETVIGGLTLGGNISVGTAGIALTNMGFMM